MAEITIRDFFLGNVPKHFIQNRVIPLGLTILGITMLISNLLFPDSYDWRYLVISDLTSSSENPKGYLSLSIGMALAGVTFIPLGGYMHTRLKQIGKFGSIMGTLFFSVGITGLILVGVIYEGLIDNIDRLHENLAIVAFGGLLLALFFWGFTRKHSAGL